jgi:hypothetical protein
MRWPDAWRDPALLDLLKGTAIDTLLIGPGEPLAAVREQARKQGLQIETPPGVSMVKGEWPGVKMGRSGGEAGPTGVPWVNSNGWAVRLAMAQNPDKTVWIDAPPVAGSFVSADSYLIAIADSAAYGGRWILSLDAPLAQSLAEAKPDAQRPWKRIVETASFFAARKQWSEYRPVANMGVLSDFTGPHEFFGQELLNLLARAGAQARAILPGGSFDGIRLLICPDSTPRSAALRAQIDKFTKSGGLLMTSEKRPADDPYLWANDAVVQLSHRNDLVRFWNSGATGSYVSTNGKETIAHLLFYSMRGPDAASVWVAGNYRSARAATVEHPAIEKLEAETKKGGMEVHLPQVSQYVALQLT